MKNSLFNFKDDEEREMFFIAIPVIALFALLGYKLIQPNAPTVVPQSASLPAATAVAPDDNTSDTSADKDDNCTTKLSGDCETNATTTAQIKEEAMGVKSDQPDTVRINSNENTENSIATSGYKVAETVNDWGDGFNASFVHVVTEEETQNGALSKWKMNLGYTGDAKINSAWMTSYNGRTHSSYDNGDYVITNEEEIYQPTLSTGDIITFNVSASGAGYADEDFSLQFTPLDSQINETNNSVAITAPVDTDTDGIGDDTDQCPDQPGPAVSNGCPIDTDNDGVFDADDACPTVAGDQPNGCAPATPATPDSDGDGLSDTEDNCPQKAGFEYNQGCPADTDDDGFTDFEDQCPDISGQINGCPQDTDGDGIADADDNCPDEAGVIESIGCPPLPSPDAFEARQILDAAISGVKFNSSSAILTARSREILRTVSDLMEKYPEATLDILGHTDSSGNAGKNLQLSIDRARACATFIAAQGISTDRLQAYGFGDTQPLVDNSTVAGRERNRRVEFVLKNAFTE